MGHDNVSSFASLRLVATACTVQPEQLGKLRSKRSVVVHWRDQLGSSSAGVGGAGSDRGVAGCNGHSAARRVSSPRAQRCS